MAIDLDELRTPRGESSTATARLVVEHVVIDSRLVASRHAVRGARRVSTSTDTISSSRRGRTAPRGTLSTRSVDGHCVVVDDVTAALGAAGPSTTSS